MRKKMTSLSKTQREGEGPPSSPPHRLALVRGPITWEAVNQPPPPPVSSQQISSSHIFDDLSGREYFPMWLRYLF